MGRMAFQARNLSRASENLRPDAAGPRLQHHLCLAGSLVSAGLKGVVVDMIRHRMADIVVSTGQHRGSGLLRVARLPALHGHPPGGRPGAPALHIDRIYDTFIDEDELRECDMTVARIADGLEPRALFLPRVHRGDGGVFSRSGGADGRDRPGRFEKAPSSPGVQRLLRGFGLVQHQSVRKGLPCVTIDSARGLPGADEHQGGVGPDRLFMVGGGGPKNFGAGHGGRRRGAREGSPDAQYAIQLTVADDATARCPGPRSARLVLGKSGHGFRADGVRRSHGHHAAFGFGGIPRGRVAGPPPEEPRGSIAHEPAGRSHPPDDEEIERLLARPKRPDSAQVRDVLAKAREARGLTPREVSVLFGISDPELSRRAVRRGACRQGPHLREASRPVRPSLHFEPLRKRVRLLRLSRPKQGDQRRAHDLRGDRERDAGARVPGAQAGSGRGRRVLSQERPRLRPRGGSTPCIPSAAARGRSAGST